MSSLYESIGGEAAVNAAVDLFYRKVLSDDRISSFFEGVDMETQAAKQKAFLTLTFGGPSAYNATPSLYQETPTEVTVQAKPSV